MQENTFKSGFVTVAGKPNVGKSTLINALMGQKVVIVSEKPQTTRNRINCILTEDNYQIVFVDTPGIHKPLRKIGEYMLNIAVNALRGIDLILFVVDAKEGIRDSDLRAAEVINASKVPTILVINKIDQLKDRGKIQKISEELRNICGNIFESLGVSALTGENLSLLKQIIIDHLPYGPQYYPEDMITDKPSRFIISELIREKIFLLTKEEVPHSTGVVVEELKERENGVLYVRAEIYVERKSQKPIIIGKNGAMIKKIGELARKDIEELFEQKVYLDLYVRVKEKWRDNESILNNIMEYKTEFTKER
ncbi:GTPase Era [Petrotoga sp. 9PWA.NaAc.5.4]|uniref:GTPase Era n=1 Tax=Petrotoga sp. 9PWA.NaAc.5.4 TaxID=1434328 RepID=UPI000CB7D6A9|nr:GTPase Era [Petrotoga sp. 9PWA.NaAc.5.4]PNR92266.1 GTPase Era [Petrotoga sp. 9PWA.NaAc.5.4]